jgi:type VI secretion system secreted protein VgrG
MVDYKHNQPYYELHLANIKDGTVKVLSFEGEEEVSNLFEYRIDLVSEDPEINAPDILNETAAFILNRGDEDPIKIHGIISNFEQFGKTSNYVFYRATLVPQIWRLNLVFQNEVYQHLDISKIIEMMMEDIGLSKQNFKIDLKNAYPEKEYLVQYRESNLNFLNRRLEHYGIYYYFDQTGDKDVIVFTDSNNKLPSIPAEGKIGYNINKDPLSEKESISEITCKEKVVTGTVQLKDYDYMFPEKQLMGESQIDEHPGLYYDYGDDFESEKDAEFLAKVRNQEFLSGSKIFHGKSDCRLFSAGYKFKLEKHYRETWNSEFLIIKVKHTGNQQGLFGLLPNSSKLLPTYENIFTAIPSEIEFRPSRKTPVPKITGIMSARIDSAGDDILIDDHGRYFAKMHFDLSDRNSGDATLPIRLTQAYSGAGYGIHFPNHGGTELLWACVDGNVDRPIGIGTIPNPSNASPSVDANKTQNVIRTAADNEIIIEDKAGDEQIHIKQACGNEIHMKAPGPDIEIKQACGNQILMKEAEGIHIKDKYGNEVKLDAASGFIRIASPSKDSYIELGKSIIWNTLSNLTSTIAGNWKGIVMGEKAEIVTGPAKVKWDGISQTTHGGMTQDNFIGVTSSNFIGAKITAEASTSFTKTKGSKRTYCDASEKIKSADKNEDVAGSYDIKVGSELNIVADSQIYFKVGGTEILIDGSGITMTAEKITLAGKSEIKLESSLTNIPRGEIKHKDGNIT